MTFSKKLALAALIGASAILPATPAMAQQPFVGEMIEFSGNFCPSGWELADGHLLSIADNDVLFALIGTIYGGDGQNTFAVPDLRGRSVVHTGTGAGLSTYTIGQTGGSETVTLTTNQIPAHSHTAYIKAFPTDGNSNSPIGNHFAKAPSNEFSSVAGPANFTAADTLLVAPNVGSQPTAIVQPVLAMHWCISLFGVFPSQN